MSDRGIVRNYKIVLEAKAPVFIGSGATVSKKDSLWIPDEESVYILDLQRVFAGLKKLGLLKAYEDYLLDHRQKNFSDFIRSQPELLSAEICREWAAYSLYAQGIAESGVSRKMGGGSDDIMAFIKDPFGCPYVPGSSLKGALRTVIQGAEIIADRERFAGLRSSIEREELRSRMRYLYSQHRAISDALFNTLGRNQKRRESVLNNSFAGLRISDSAPLSPEDLIMCRKLDVGADGNENPLPIRRECLRPGTRIVFDMQIDEDMFPFDGTKLLSCADIFYKDYLDRFLSAFGETAQACDNGNHLLLLGGGAGYATKTTLYPLYEDKDAAVRSVQRIMVETTSSGRRRDPHNHSDDSEVHRISPHIRKRTRIAGELYDFGLCGISIEPV